MKSLNIVVVSTEPPDPFGNAAGRWYYVLAKGLCKQVNRVRWLAAYSSEVSAARARAYLGHLGLNLRLYPYPARSLYARKWQTLLRPYSYFISKELVQDLKTELESGYDVLHLEQTWAGWLGIGVPRALLSIHWLALVDMCHPFPRSLGPFLFGGLMRRTERRIISQFDTIRVLTARDGRVVQELNPKARIFRIPLAIDPTLYRFEPTKPPRPTIGLVGSMGWQPNYSAAKRLITCIWPAVKTKVTDARLLIVGWRARRSLGQFINLPDVTILEDVDEAESYFRQLSVLAYPVTNGSGMKVKVLEAMAYGVPVVTTPEGVEGIEAVDGYHASIAQETRILAQKVIWLLENREARMNMAIAARQLIEERYSPAPAMSQMETVYERTINSRS
jgi:glycosyltransferase involved in cell wall biosynthesis